MRADLLLQATQMALDDVFGRQITMHDLAETVRSVLRNDPIKAERVVGRLYGLMFRKREMAYDTQARR